MHLARCYRIVDLGTQEVTYKGDTKLQHKIMLQFEVHGEDDSGKPLVTDKGEPMSISKNFTLSLGEKATLRADLEAWRGRAFTPEELQGFDIAKLLGVWAMLAVSKDVGQDGKQYTNIKNINPVPKVLKDTVPLGFNKPAIFSINNPDMELFDTFSKSTKAKIEKSPEWQAVVKRGGAPAPVGGTGFDDMEDDIPF
jgi:hypothetical protein